MSKEECGVCEFQNGCWPVLKLKNKLVSTSCGNYRKKIVRQQKLKVD